MKIEKLILYAIDLRLFDGDLNTNTTGDSGLTTEMKTFYSDYLIEMADAKLVHHQFGQKKPIPKNGGKTVEFRKYDPLPKITTELSEGITPNGQKLTVVPVTATVKQYGGYVALTDILLMTAIDNNLAQATKLLGSQAGRTLDTLTREVLNGGTNVQYANGSVSSRSALTKDHKLTVDCIRRAARNLKVMNAEPIDDSFVAIIHPDCAYDLMSDPDWKYPHQYKDTENLYNGEIGKVAGVRFVETTEAKVFHADDLAINGRTLTVAADVSNKNVVSFETSRDITPGELVGRAVIINGMKYYVSANTVNTITLAHNAAGTQMANINCKSQDIIYPGEAGANGIDVYSTLVLGDNAYGVVDIEGGGLEHIVKQLGSAGTADPLNQRATAGWKATHAAIRLVEAYMIRIETASTFDVGAN